MITGNADMSAEIFNSKRVSKTWWSGVYKSVSEIFLNRMISAKHILLELT